MSELLSAYRYWRRNRSAASRPSMMTATAALANARRDVAEGKRRYGPSPWRKGDGNNPMSEERAVWIESPSSMGLRFVGYADELVKLDHTGWFTNDFGDTIRGVVYQLPGRDGKARFVAGHDNADNGAAHNGGPAYVDFSQIIESDFEAEMRDALRSMGKHYHTPERLKPGYWAEAAHESARKEAARAANEFTRVQAEREREYNTAWQAGSMWRDTVDEIRGEREHVKAMLGEWRTVRDKARMASVPALCGAIRASIASSIARVQELRDKRDKLASGDYQQGEIYLGFYPSPELRAAFNEGAGEAVL